MDASEKNYEVKIESNKVRILYNAIKTPDGTVIESKHRHDFVCHIDANGRRYCVDGGLNYLRRTADIFDYEDLSVMDDENHETRRKCLFWGINYTKEGKWIEEGTIWKHIKDLDTDHIENIIQGNYVRHVPFYEEVFRDELKYRRNVKTSS
jgi:hypothetical protein